MEPAPWITLRERMRRAKLEMEVLRQFSLAVHAPRDIRSLYRQLYEAARQLMPIQAAFINLFDPDTRLFQSVFSIDKEIIYPGDEPWELRPGGPTEWLVRTKQPVRFNDLEREMPERFPAGGSLIPFGDTEALSKSWLAVPMLVDQQVRGVVCVQSYQAGVYGPREERVLLTLGSMLAVAVQHARFVANLQGWHSALAAAFILLTPHTLLLPLTNATDRLAADELYRSLVQRLKGDDICAVLLDVGRHDAGSLAFCTRLWELAAIIEEAGARPLLIDAPPALLEQLQGQDRRQRWRYATYASIEAAMAALLRQQPRSA